MDAIEVFKPDSYTLPSDEVKLTLKQKVNPFTGKNRIIESLKRNLQWSKTYNKPEMQSFPFTLSSEYIKSIQHINSTIGYTIPLNANSDTLSLSMSQCPILVRDKNTPYEIILSIESGGDLYTTNYPYILTEAGEASLYVLIKKI